jgi:hypothetical protein
LPAMKRALVDGTLQFQPVKKPSRNVLADVAELKERWEHLASTAAVLTKSEIHQMHRIVEASKGFMDLRRERRLGNAGPTPFLRSYSSDISPVLTVERIVRQLDGRMVIRYVKQLVEYLMEREFVVTDPDMDESYKVTAKIGEPLKMTSKKAVACLAAMIRFGEFAHEKGFKGIGVYHFAFDRAAFDTMCWLIIGYFSKVNLRLENQFGLTMEMRDLLMWKVFTACGSTTTRSRRSGSTSTSSGTKPSCEICT